MSSILALASSDTAIVLAQGLAGLQEKAINNWIGPAFLLGVAGISIIFIKDRAWMKLLGFLGIAAIVGMVIYFGSQLFGKDGNLTSGVKSLADDVNVVNVSPTIPGQSHAEILESAGVATP